MGHTMAVALAGVAIRRCSQPSDLLSVPDELWRRGAGELPLRGKQDARFRPCPGVGETGAEPGASGSGCSGTDSASRVCPFRLAVPCRYWSPNGANAPSEASIRLRVARQRDAARRDLGSDGWRVVGLQASRSRQQLLDTRSREHGAGALHQPRPYNRRRPLGAHPGRRIRHWRAPRSRRRDADPETNARLSSPRPSRRGDAYAPAHDRGRLG